MFWWSLRAAFRPMIWMMIVRVEVKVMIATPESACSTMKYSVTSISDQVSAS